MGPAVRITPMGVSVGAQTISITASAVLGLGAGLLYDVLRQIRAVSGRIAGILCEVFFCLLCTAALFVLGMAFCGGRLGVWEGAGFLVAFWLYLVGVSPSVTPFFGICRQKAEKFLKKFEKKEKKYFHFPK